MTKTVFFTIRKILIVAIFINCSTSTLFPQSSAKQIQRKINNLFADKFFESSLAAIDIYDLTKKKTIYQKNNKLLLHPASNMKILTSAAGLKYLGKDYQFKTSLYYQGEIIDSVLVGHLFVVGGCDPDFTSKDLEVLTLKVKDAGIKKITGNIYGDVSMSDSLFWGNGWMWDDDPYTDEPYFTPLTINDNAITIIGEYDNLSQKLIFNSIPETEYIQIIENIKIDSLTRKSSFRVQRDWINRTNKFFIDGVIAQNGNEKRNFSERFNIYKPEKYFLTLFKESLIRNDIDFTGNLEFKPLNESSKSIFTFTRTYDSVIVNLNKTSDNLSTEMTLRALAEKYFGKPASAENGLKMIDSLLIVCGLNPKDYRLADGSGVSHYNLISAELLLSVLKQFYYNEPELYTTLFKSFPIAGVDGTLENRMKNTLAKNIVHAKTGTLSGVASLSGYIENRKGGMIAFSVLVQNYVGSSKQARDFIDKVCEILAE
ncbi:MAG: D-alanyl-D-alanine carboxypeptidase/D-alanyl-D-alanine-endopeptidase [Ignavibacteriaceae bacterium]|nr:D-alanyl-D-alanine carboxypeptidase/D-alanyl-D-alanine-endopeptidase [Ignavibacteriaceae bacterium]